MLHYTNRKDRIFVLTLDPHLAADVDERIRFDSRMIGVELIVPAEGAAEIVETDVATLARDTISAKIIVFDLRSHTLPRLQEAYNRVVGFNRADLNERCFTVCIGDGPARLLEPGGSPEVFAPALAQWRLDYSAAAFFYDPFMHYAHNERPRVGVDGSNRLPTAVPQRLAEGFKEDDIDVPAIRRFFRGANASFERKESVKAARQLKFVKLYKTMLKHSFPGQAKDLADWLSMDGHRVCDEVLRLHAYPCHFEDWIWRLWCRADEDGR